MEKLPIKIEIHSSNFWWSEYGFRPSFFEDIDILYEKDGKDFWYNTTLYVPKCFQLEKERDKWLKENEKDPEKLLELEEENPDEACLESYGMTRDQLINTDKILFGYGWDDEEKEEINDFAIELPKKNGLNPLYVDVVYPAEMVNKEIVEKAITEFLKYFLKIEPISFEFLKPLTLEETKKDFKETLEEEKEAEEYRKSGGKYTVKILPEALIGILGKEVLEKYGDQIKDGEILENKEILLTFKDGHTEIFDPEKKDWEND